MPTSPVLTVLLRQAALEVGVLQAADAAARGALNGALEERVVCLILGDALVESIGLRGRGRAREESEARKSLEELHREKAAGRAGGGARVSQGQ